MLTIYICTKFKLVVDVFFRIMSLTQSGRVVSKGSLMVHLLCRQFCGAYLPLCLQYACLDGSSCCLIYQQEPYSQVSAENLSAEDQSIFCAGLMNMAGEVWQGAVWISEMNSSRSCDFMFVISCRPLRTVQKTLKRLEEKIHGRVSKQVKISMLVG